MSLNTAPTASVNVLTEASQDQPQQRLHPHPSGSPRDDADIDANVNANANASASQGAVVAGGGGGDAAPPPAAATAVGGGGGDASVSGTNLDGMGTIGGMGGEEAMAAGVLASPSTRVRIIGGDNSDRCRCESVSFCRNYFPFIRGLVALQLAAFSPFFPYPCFFF